MIILIRNYREGFCKSTAELFCSKQELPGTEKRVKLWQECHSEGAGSPCFLDRTALSKLAPFSQRVQFRTLETVEDVGFLPLAAKVVVEL